MLFNSRTSTLLQAGLDAMWMKQKVISNNISNNETPNYNAKTLDFQEIIDNKINEVNGKIKTTYTYRGIISTDTTSTMSVNGNNVDIEKEEAELWKTYAQYTYLQTLMSKEISGINYVIANTGK